MLTLNRLLLAASMSCLIATANAAPIDDALVAYLKGDHANQKTEQPRRTAGNSNFASVKLPRGIELQMPKGWWLLGPDIDRMIQTSIEATFDLSGMSLPDGQQINLIAANSMPRSTYATVRVDSRIPPSIMPSEFTSITATDIREMETEIRKTIQKMLPFQGNRLIEFIGVRIEKISDYPTIVTEYRRTGLKGPVFVQLNQIFTSSQEISINLSYRESELAFWKPVIGKIRQSIVIRR
jgi:hypothetical protein